MDLMKHTFLVRSTKFGDRDTRRELFYICDGKTYGTRYLWRDGTVHTGSGAGGLKPPELDKAPGYWTDKDAAQKFLDEWQTYPRKIPYGIMGLTYYEQMPDGSIRRLVIVQESRLNGGSPPNEMRIRCLVPFNDEEFGKQFCAFLNRQADLPYYLGWATVKMELTPAMTCVRDHDLEMEGIKPLEDEAGEKAVKEQGI